MKHDPYLSILCVTKGEAYAEPFLAHIADLGKACEAEVVIAADGYDALERVFAIPKLAEKAALVRVESRGYVESVLDYAIAGTKGRWVLRLDDDERVTPEMGAWLQDRAFLLHPVWSFRRLNLWRDEKHVLVDPMGLLWPDPQTRLSHRELAGGRYKIHQASPHGLGKIAPNPVCIEHHKLLVKTLDERRAITKRYDAIEPGKGSGVFLPFSCPEDYFKPNQCGVAEVAALLRAHRGA
jgi:hypothetical protein